jgi:DNA invertase Pin-like site-specific DNA recombinase
MTDTTRPPKVKDWHLDRSAAVYVRQSTLQQVAEHQESTARQYALADRAVALGWPRDRVQVIDDDLGKSGRSAEGRPGFQRLLAEVALDHVGLILGLEVSRLARSCKDWHQLLEACARFRVLLADADGLYDPSDYNDRLLLGLKGTMSEAELHVLRDRLHQGKLNKARRGELIGRTPIGYIRAPSGEWAIDPDEQVQAVVRLIFDQFDRLPTLHAVLRYLVRHGVRVPVRPHGGPNKGQLEWRRPNRSTLSDLVRHPSYAGAYRYGYKQIDPRYKSPCRPGSGLYTRRPHECHVLIRDRVPAYITWDRFQANQQRLAANQYRPGSPGAPRDGAAILGGLVWCGRCGQRMAIRYSGSRSRHWYTCTGASGDHAEPSCQTVSGPVVDELVAAQVLAAVAPAALEASLAAVAEVERERAALARQWQLRRERARYDAERASRQYHACEPENRLVARELERRWEEALGQQRQVEDEYDRWLRSVPARLTDEDARAIRSLAADLPAVWAAPTTTPADRQRIARLLLERVTVAADRASERVDVELRWVGGLVRSHVVARPVNRYDLRSEYPRLVGRLRELAGAGLGAASIAERLNAEGFRPPRRTGPFTGSIVWRLANRLGVPRRRHFGSAMGLGPDEYRPPALARRLGVSPHTVQRWIDRDQVRSRRDAEGRLVLWADAPELIRLRGLRRPYQRRARTPQAEHPGEPGPSPPG